MAGTINIIAFDKNARTISFTTPLGTRIDVAGLDPDLDDAGLKDFLSSLSNTKDAEAVVASDPIAKTTLKAGDTFVPTIADTA
jgi:hypothetical protein